MELICSKDKKDFGTEDDNDKVWVVKCEGETIFPASGPLPKKALMNDLIHQAFAGKFHDEFLEFMYPTYAEEKAQSPKQMKEEMKLKKEQRKLQSEIVGGFHVDPNGEEEEEKRNDKFLKQQKREKLKLQRQKEKEKREKQRNRKKQLEERQREKEAREEKKERLQERQRQRDRKNDEKGDKEKNDDGDGSGRLLRTRSI